MFNFVEIVCLTYYQAIILLLLLISLINKSLIYSWQVGLHGRQLRAQTNRTGVHHPRGGVTQRDDGPRQLHHQVQVHRWRPTRSSQLGVVPLYQERLDRLIPSSTSSIDVFLCFVPLSLAVIPLFLSGCVDLSFCSLRPSTTRSYISFFLNSNHSIIPPLVTLSFIWTCTFLLSIKSLKNGESKQHAQSRFCGYGLFIKEKVKKNIVNCSQKNDKLLIRSALYRCLFFIFPDCFVQLPWSALESIVQEVVVLYVRGHCAVTEQSLLDTTLGRSPPKAFEQIICTRVLVNYLEFRPPLFQII